LAESARKIVSRYEDRLAKLNEEMKAELAPTKERLDAVWHAVQDAAGDLEVVLPKRPTANSKLADESGWLYDSNRDYLGQLTVYQRRKSLLDEHDKEAQ
jgi:hypothetical protein